MGENNENGKFGEALAAAYLKSKGYSILATNRKFSHAEIDIIAKIGEDLVFIEVKTRKNSHFGYPEEFIDAKKIRLMGKAAELYCVEIGQDLEIRFDLISLILEGKEHEIIHIEDAFFPEDE